MKKISNRPSRSGGPIHVKEGCYSSFRSQRRAIYQLIVSCEKKRWTELSSSQPKEPEQQYSVSALQDRRAVPIKGNIVTRGKTCKIDLKSYLEPTSTLQFLGVIVDSGEMTLSLIKEKLLSKNRIIARQS